MRSKTIWALAALNILLLMSLCFHNFFGASANAQAAGARIPPPSEYQMISGEITGGNGSGVVFILDTRNNYLGGRILNGKVTEDLQPVELSHIFK